jgi:hypothetical protein
VSIPIVATPGDASANSFVSIAVADAYLATRLNASAWGTDDVEVDDDVKAQALCEATRELSALPWQGNRASSTQSLAWPRSGATNPDGQSRYDEYDVDVIPQRIKDATCELALEFLRAGTTDVAGAGSTDGIIEKTVDVLTTVYAQPSQRATGLARFPRIMNLVAPLFDVTAGQVRLVR